MRRLRRLVTKRATRWSEQRFVVEGVELSRLALEDPHRVEGLYVDEASKKDTEHLKELAHAHGVRVFELADGVLSKVTDTVTPQPALAVCAMDQTHDFVPEEGLCVVLIDVRDPGNAGTILRTADAAGCASVIFCGESVDPYNPKTVRSSAGSVLWVPHHVAPDTFATLAVLKEQGVRLCATSLTGQVDYTECDWGATSALLCGNEAQGLSQEVMNLADVNVTISMEGRAESLNVAVATSVVCFEALRQKRRR